MYKEIICRDFSRNDFEEIQKLWLSTGLGNPARGDNVQVIEETIKCGGKLIVAETSVTHEIVGTSWLTTDKRRVYLHHFGVKPEYQRQGIGNLLATESIRFAKQLGLQLKLEVHIHNSKAIELYRKFNFTFWDDYYIGIIRDIQNVTN